MGGVPLHLGTAADGFSLVHRGQVVSFEPGRVEVDDQMRAAIDAASDAEVEWDEGGAPLMAVVPANVPATPDPESIDALPEAAATRPVVIDAPKRRGRPPKVG